MKTDARPCFPASLVAALACVLLILAPTANAQVTLDGSMGPAGELSGPDYVITSGMGTQTGANLFHSFGLFNVNTGQSATFTGPESVSNVIGRVTGGQISTIDGVLRNAIPEANLYLINPAGVIFGPNAALDVGGSFTAATADYVRLADGGRFDAANPAATTLTVAPVSAFGFLDGAASPIGIYGSVLEVPDGESISVIGGDTTLHTGYLIAPGGRVDLASVASGGEVYPSSDGLDTGSFEAMGTIDLYHSPDTPHLQRNIAGAEYLSGNVDVSGEGAGAVYIRGGRLVMDGAQVYADTFGSSDGAGVDASLTDEVSMARYSGVTSDSIGSGSGGDVRVSAPVISLDDTSWISTSAIDDGGSGGDVIISAPARLTLSNSSYVDSSSYSTGNGGDITISAGDIRLGGASSIDTETYSTGDAGNLTIKSGRLTVSGDSMVSANTYDEGKGGNLDITASEILLYDEARVEASSQGHGDGGTLRIKSGSLSITGQAQVNAIVTDEGAGGSIHIDTGNLYVSGGGNFPSGVYAQNKGGASGAAGDVSINAASVLVTDGGVIDSSAYGTGDGGNVAITATESVTLSYGGDVQAQSYAGATGDAGSIRITAPYVAAVNGSSIDANTYSAGNGGDITVNADTIYMNRGDGDGSTGVFATSLSSATGNAGDINVYAGKLTLADGAQINALTRYAGDGGTIRIEADEIRIYGSGGGYPSGMFTSSDFLGKGGSISVVADSMTMSDTAFISSGVEGSGDGGSVNITAGALTLDGDSRIEASTAAGSSGDGGALVIRAGSVSLSNDSQIRASTEGLGDGGAVDIKSYSLSVESGSYIITNTFGSGAGGRIRLESNRMLVSGPFPTGVFADTDLDGLAGDIVIFADDLVLADSGRIRAGTFGRADGGAVKVTAKNIVMDTGARLETSAFEGASGNAGDLEIEAGSLAIKGQAQINAITYADTSGDGGNIRIDAGDILVTGGGDFPSGIFAQSKGNTTGDAGNIVIKARNLEVADGGYIDSSTAGAGRGGNVNITARRLTGSGGARIQASAFVNSSGDAGNLKINAGEISLESQAQINAIAEQNTSGNGGNIEINAEWMGISGGGDFPTGVFAQTKTGSLGNAGSLIINVGELVVKGAATIDSSTAGAGNGGDVKITAQDIYNMDEGRISASALSGSTGNAGNIRINAGLLSVTGQAQVNAITYEDSLGDGGDIVIDADTVYVNGGGRFPSGIFTQAKDYSFGKAGNVRIGANNLTVTNGALIDSSAFSTGDGGNVTINASAVEVGDFGAVTCNSYLDSPAAGVAGNIYVTAGDYLSLNRNGSVETTSENTGGGDITITAGAVKLTNRSDITATVYGGFGGGGNLDIDTGALAAFNDSDITANAYFGAGGNINIYSEAYFHSEFSDITASSRFGLDGVVEVESPELDLSGALSSLTASFKSEEALLTDACAAGAMERRSSFIVRGAEGTPRTPGGPVFPGKEPGASCD